METRKSTRKRRLCECGEPVNITINMRYDDYAPEKCERCQAAQHLCDCGKWFNTEYRMMKHRQRHASSHASKLLFLATQGTWYLKPLHSFQILTD